MPPSAAHRRDEARETFLQDIIGRAGLQSLDRELLPLLVAAVEFDVRDDTFPDDIATRDAMIAETAEKFLNIVLPIPAVKMVIAWELADNYSFYTDAAKKKDPLAQRLPRPLPFDDAMQKKPLWFAMARAFENAKKA